MVVIELIPFPITFNSGAIFCDDFLSGYEILHLKIFLTHSCYDWDPILETFCVCSLICVIILVTFRIMFLSPFLVLHNTSTSKMWGMNFLPPSVSLFTPEIMFQHKIFRMIRFPINVGQFYAVLKVAMSLFMLLMIDLFVILNF